MTEPTAADPASSGLSEQKHMRRLGQPDPAPADPRSVVRPGSRRPRWVHLGLVIACLVGTQGTVGAAEPQSAPLHAQMDAERHALALIRRPDIQRAFMQIEAEWRRAAPGLLPESYARLGGSLHELLLMAALQIIDDDPRRPQVIEISAAPHRWFGTDVPGGRWGINNPDTLYFTIPVEPGSRYVITGKQHAAGPTDANFTVQTGADWLAADNLALPQLRIDRDGGYAITVDDQPASGRANHLRISSEANVVLIRDTLADWSRELPDTLTVTRVAGPPPGPPQSDDELARQVIVRLRAVVARSVTGLQARVMRQPVNVIAQPGGSGDKPGFLVTQRNTLAHFRLADDEAIVATLDPGGAGYTTFPVTDIWGVAPDSRRHQNSLNDRQAAMNPDGTITVVLANWDPGVANWIDPAGLHEGIIMPRWQLLGSAATGREPAISARVVRRADLTATLSQSLARVTLSERRAQLGARAAGFDRRFTGR